MLNVRKKTIDAKVLHCIPRLIPKSELTHVSLIGFSLLVLLSLDFHISLAFWPLLPFVCPLLMALCCSEVSQQEVGASSLTRRVS
jgi:hypothetical protein